MISRARLEAILGQFSRLSVGLVGDLFLDRYLDIDPELRELSVETGLEAYQVTRVRNSPGALGTVINNLAALGIGKLVPVSVLGDDGQAFDLRKELARLPVEMDHLLTDPQRTTPTYTKPMQRGSDGIWRELNRLDLRNRRAISLASEQQVIEHLYEVFSSTDGLIVMDQVTEEGWGVVTPSVRAALRQLATGDPNKLMFIDSRANLARFDFGTLKPNERECLAAASQRCGQPIVDVAQAAASLAVSTGRSVFCTLGPRGIFVGTAQDGQLVPARRLEEPIDTVGAGDSATSGIVAALLAGASEIEAAEIGNLAASITIKQLGTTGTASPEQLLSAWANLGE
jgi:rfaE bifunctional protein kinase chain/domain